jgi:hypothetical protein
LVKKALNEVRLVWGFFYFTDVQGQVFILMNQKRRKMEGEKTRILAKFEKLRRKRMGKGYEKG